MMLTPPDWDAVRDEFPMIESSVYLNTAGGAPIPRSVAAAGARFYEEMRDVGDAMWPVWLERVERVRAKAAALMGAPASSIAFVPTSSAAMNIVAGYMQAAGVMSVVSMADSFPSIVVPLKHWGFDVSWVPSSSDGAVEINDVATHVTPDTGALVVSSVEYGTSFAHDLREMSRLCRRHDLAFVVDATQSLGAFPLDVGTLGIDFAMASTYKWLLGGYGLAVMYIAPRWLERKPPVAGWMSTATTPEATSELALKPSASVVELGCPNFPAIFALGAALDFLDDLGATAVEHRVRELAAHLVDTLGDRGLSVASNTEASHMSGIVHVAVEDPARVVAELRERGVFVSAKGLGIRVSVYVYNSIADIEGFADILADVVDPANHGGQSGLSE